MRTKLGAILISRISIQRRSGGRTSFSCLITSKLPISAKNDFEGESFGRNTCSFQGRQNR
jgi:hypothetical protein